MPHSSLDTFIAAARAAWGPLTTERVAACRQALARLLQAPASEPWLARLVAEAPENQVLHHDPDHGFVLLAHTEARGLYRRPHDHGAGSVIYAIQAGASEMATYARTQETGGAVRLVERDRTQVTAGQVRVYLPGDIHDTRCTTDRALLFRFTDRDLRDEDRQGRLTRYVDHAGVWRPPER